MNSRTNARVGIALARELSDRPIVKELATKLAWALGSTMHITYGERSKIKIWAEYLAVQLYQNYSDR